MAPFVVWYPSRPYLFWPLFFVWVSFMSFFGGSVVNFVFRGSCFLASCQADLSLICLMMFNFRASRSTFHYWVTIGFYGFMIFCCGRADVFTSLFHTDLVSLVVP